MDPFDLMPVRLPRNAFEAIQTTLLPPDATPESTLRLIIEIEPEGFPARDLGGYLSFIDRVYGRLDPSGLSSYSHRKEGQLRIDALRVGSVHIEISRLVENGATLTVLYLVLKFLPAFLKSLSGAFRDLEEARLARVRRAQLRRQLAKEASASTLPDHYVTQIVAFLDYIYTRERSSLGGAQRFSEKHVKNICLVIRHHGKRKRPDEGEP